MYWHEQDGHIIYELTSSALNQTIERFISGEGQPEQDPNRLQEAVVETNFGWMNIDWANGTVEVSLRSARTGDVLQSHMLPLSAEQSPLPETNSSKLKTPVQSVFSKLTSIDFEAGVRLPSANLSMGTSTLASGKYEPKQPRGMS